MAVNSVRHCFLCNNLSYNVINVTCDVKSSQKVCLLLRGLFLDMFVFTNGVYPDLAGR